MATEVVDEKIKGYSEVIPGLTRAKAIFGIACFQAHGSIKETQGVLYGMDTISFLDKPLFIGKSDVVLLDNLEYFITLPIFNVKWDDNRMTCFDAYTGKGFLRRFAIEDGVPIYCPIKYLHTRKNLAFGQEIGLEYGLFYYNGKRYTKITPCQTLDGKPCDYGKENFKA